MAYREGRRLRTSTKRPGWCEIDTRNADAQTQSSLVRLPAEIRNLIYEYVFGAGSIHFGVRQCKYTDLDFPARNGYKVKQYNPNWELLEAGYLPEDEDNALPSQKYAGTKYYKVSYCTCDESRDWDEAYSLSKKPVAESNQDFDDLGVPQEHTRPRELLWSYCHRHTHREGPMNDLAHQQYAGVCKHRRSSPFGSLPCQGCYNLRELLTATYGDPVNCLKDYHGGSAFNLRLLQTCKQIYHETKLLPYTSHNFDFNSGYLAREVALYQLGSFRARAIQSIHLEDVRCAEDFSIVSLYFQGLRHLRLSLKNEREPLYGEMRTWQKFFQLNRLESVEVIVGHDVQNESGEKRSRRAERAKTIEQFLLSADVDEAERHAAEYEGRDVGDKWHRNLGTKELWFKARATEKDEEGAAGQRRDDSDRLDEAYLRQLLDRGVFEVGEEPPRWQFET